MNAPQLLPIGRMFDGTYGDDFNGLRIQALAKEYGWTGQQEDDNSLEFQEAIDEATEYLEQFALDGYYAGWREGDYGVWEADDKDVDQFHSNQDEPEDSHNVNTHAVIEFLRGADGYETKGMQQHGHFPNWEAAAAKAEQLRKAGDHGRISIVPLIDASAYLD